MSRRNVQRLIRCGARWNASGCCGICGICGSGSAMTGSEPSIREPTGPSGRLWRRSLASPPGKRQHAKGTRLRAVPPKWALGASVHDDTATAQAPRITDLDDAHVEPDRQDIIRSQAFGDERSPNAWVCPFLRAVGDDGRPGPPIEVPDVANRCASAAESVPQSLRQQELVCLTSGHVNCPRYLRGSVAPAGDLE